ncbi:MAG: hypothetical protein V1934_02700 [Methanobacteriota archaeon]
MITNFEFTSIDARRFTKLGEAMGNIRIDHNSSITLISEINNKEANVEFRFTANYSSIGFIKIEGKMVFEGNASAVAKQWQTEHKMPDDVATQVHQAIMMNCVPEAVMVSRDLKMPPPIPMPQVNIGKSPGPKPSSGIEVA